MVKIIKKVNTENPALKEVISSIKDKKSFILEAGAGSGKTWDLVESLKICFRKLCTFIA